MLLLIDIFSINKGWGYENPSLKIIVTEHCPTRGCPLEEACEHFFLNQSVISVVVLILFMCYCGDYASYITVTLPFLAFYFCSAYFLYLVSCKIHKTEHKNNNASCKFITQLTLILVRISPTACIPSMNLLALDHTAHHSQHWVTPEMGLNSTRVKGFLARLMVHKQ